MRKLVPGFQYDEARDRLVTLNLDPFSDFYQIIIINEMKNKNK